MARRIEIRIREPSTAWRESIFSHQYAHEIEHSPLSTRQGKERGSCSFLGTASVPSPPGGRRGSPHSTKLHGTGTHCTPTSERRGNRLSGHGIPPVANRWNFVYRRGRTTRIGRSAEKVRIEDGTHRPTSISDLKELGCPANGTRSVGLTIPWGAASGRERCRRAYLVAQRRAPAFAPPPQVLPTPRHTRDSEGAPRERDLHPFLRLQWVPGPPSGYGAGFMGIYIHGPAQGEPEIPARVAAFMTSQALVDPGASKNKGLPREPPTPEAPRRV